MTPEPEVKGLPEGVQFVGDFGAAGPNDYELIRDADGMHIYKGQRAGASVGVRVVPADGYVFVKVGDEKIFDIRRYTQIVGRPEFAATKKLEAPQSVTVTAKFVVENELENSNLESALRAIEGWPGFVSVEKA
jgi:hypothetical protein